MRPFLKLITQNSSLFTILSVKRSITKDLRKDRRIFLRFQNKKGGRPKDDLLITNS